MLHNFPEGLASGSALSGLDLNHALPLLGAISLQNVPEGALMVVCLRALGWSPRASLLGGFASGAVELFGGIFAGILFQFVTDVLPLVMSFAGGAMMTSVIIELSENKRTWLTRIFSQAFTLGFLLLPLFQFITVD
jgi:ZIP family zinc transporter